MVQIVGVDNSETKEATFKWTVNLIFKYGHFLTKWSKESSTQGGNYKLEFDKIKSPGSTSLDFFKPSGFIFCFV